MIVKLLGHTSLSQNFIDELVVAEKAIIAQTVPAGQQIALSAIRTCYSPNKPSEIVKLEGDKYFKQKATKGEGKEVDRLIRHIVGSGHTSTLEHISFTFAVEGVSRALLAQLTRHRVGLSFSVQSQRYVKQSSDSKHGGFDYVIPQKVKDNPVALAVFKASMRAIQADYDALIALKVPQEDARAVLPQCATCNLVLTINLRALLDFYAKRQKGKGAQHEITQLAEELKAGAIEVEPWIESFFGGAK